MAASMAAPAQSGHDADLLIALLGVFNSSLANWWFVRRFGVLMEVGVFKVGQIPLPKAWSRTWHKLVPQVQQILAAKRADVTADTSRLEAEIDRLVYALYGLTPAEIALVEGPAKS